MKITVKWSYFENIVKGDASMYVYVYNDNFL